MVGPPPLKYYYISWIMIQQFNAYSIFIVMTLKNDGRKGTGESNEETRKHRDIKMNLGKNLRIIKLCQFGRVYILLILGE